LATPPWYPTGVNPATAHFITLASYAQYLLAWRVKYKHSPASIGIRQLFGKGLCGIPYIQRV